MPNPPVLKAKLLIERDQNGGSRVVIDHFCDGEPDPDTPTVSRMFYMAPGERMDIAIRDNVIVFESLKKGSMPDIDGNFLTGLLSGFGRV